MTDSIIINVLILAFVFIAGACVGAAAVIQKALYHARNLYAPRPILTTETSTENALRERVQQIAKLN